MYQDTQSVTAFERMLARERLAAEAREIGESGDARQLGPHLATEREAQRLMVLAAITAVAALVVLAARTMGITFGGWLP